MIDDPHPDLDLPERVGIPQQAVARKQDEEVGPRANAKRQQSSCGALCVDGIRHGNRHGVLCLMTGMASLSWIIESRQVVSSGKHSDVQRLVGFPIGKW